SVFAFQAEASARQAEQDRDRAREAERKRREQLVEAYQHQAQAGRMSRRVGQRFVSLEAIRKAAELARELELPPERFDALRNEAIACLALPDMRLAKRFGVQPTSGQLMLVDPSYTRYALTDFKGNVSIRRVADDAELDAWNAFEPGEFGRVW